MKKNIYTIYKIIFASFIDLAKLNAIQNRLKNVQKILDLYLITM